MSDLTQGEVIARRRLAVAMCADHDLYQAVSRATAPEFAAYRAALDGGDVDAIIATKVALTKAELAAAKEILKQ